MSHPEFASFIVNGYETDKRIMMPLEPFCPFAVSTSGLLQTQVCFKVKRERCGAGLAIRLSAFHPLTVAGHQANASITKNPG